MRTKKNYLRLPVFPFGLYMDMFRAGIKAAQLAASSSEVIAYRSEMISHALSGKLPVSHKEFVDMWREKMVAGTRSFLVTAKHTAQSATALRIQTPEKSIQGQVKGLIKAMTPYHQKAASNARRLRKKRTTKS